MDCKSLVCPLDTHEEVIKDNLIRLLHVARADFRV